MAVPVWVGALLAAVVGAVAVVHLFWGYRLWRAAVAMHTALLVAGIMYAIVAGLASDHISQNGTTGLAWAVGAVFGAIVYRHAKQCCAIFLVSFSVLVTLSIMSIPIVIQRIDNLNIVYYTTAGAFFGSLFIYIVSARMMLILSTSFTSALAIALAADYGLDTYFAARFLNVLVEAVHSSSMFLFDETLGDCVNADYYFYEECTWQLNDHAEKDYLLVACTFFATMTGMLTQALITAKDFDHTHEGRRRHTAGLLPPRYTEEATPLLQDDDLEAGAAHVSPRSRAGTSVRSNTGTHASIALAGAGAGAGASASASASAGASPRAVTHSVGSVHSGRQGRSVSTSEPHEPPPAYSTNADPVFLSASAPPPPIPAAALNTSPAIPATSPSAPAPAATSASAAPSSLSSRWHELRRADENM